eukprot:scaffold103646_cov57-Phaeocystis_antarctica.AAC.1
MGGDWGRVRRMAHGVSPGCDSGCPSSCSVGYTERPRLPVVPPRLPVSPCPNQPRAPVDGVHEGGAVEVMGSGSGGGGGGAEAGGRG